MNLQESISKHGILNPISVEQTSTNRYRLIDGANRLGCVPNEALVPCRIVNGESNKIAMIPKRHIRVPRR